MPIEELNKYSNSDEFYCCAVVFSPETENDHFHGCPPYIEIGTVKGDESFFFKVPEIVAYYAKTHPGYTMQGIEKRRKQGERDMANKIKALLSM